MTHVYERLNERVVRRAVLLGLASYDAGQATRGDLVRLLSLRRHSLSGSLGAGRERTVVVQYSDGAIGELELASHQGTKLPPASSAGLSLRGADGAAVCGFASCSMC